MIFAHSRYEEVDQLFVLDGQLKRRRVVNFPYYYAANFNARKHVVRQGERMEQIAALYFGDPEMWWVIAVANPEVFYPEELERGTVLRIPDAPALL